MSALRKTPSSAGEVTFKRDITVFKKASIVDDASIVAGAKVLFPSDKLITAEEIMAELGLNLETTMKILHD